MNFQKTARNITITLLLTQALTSLGSSVIATINTIVGAALSGNEALAGLPSTAIQLGAALAAYLLGRTMDRYGRRLSLGFGFLLGAAGIITAGAAIVAGNFIFFLAGLALSGFTRATSQMGRFVAAEVTPPETRGRALSYVILGGAFGSVLGPLLTEPFTSMAVDNQFNEFMGPFGFALLIYLVTAAVILIFLRPEPRDQGRLVAEAYPEALTHSGSARSMREILRNPTALTAIVSMVFGQAIMVGLMGITSLHMIKNNHGYDTIGIVFSSHTFGMFAFSIVTGQLLDRWGRGRVILTGAVMLLLSGAIAPLSLDMLPIAVALFLLGLGWNFTFLGGSTLLSDILNPDERAEIQGANDLIIGMVTAFASFASGLVFAAGGYTLSGIIGSTLSLIPLGFIIWWMMRPSEPVPA